MASIKTQNPFLFIPNIIDYCRIVLLVAVVCVFTVHPWLGIWLYVVNTILDMLDGIFARLLNQCSKLGSLLDFSIDRAGIVIVLSGCIWTCPQNWNFFVAILGLDIATHFAVCYATAFNAGSHLDFIARGSWLLKQFSQKSWVKYIICTSHDVFFAVFIANFFKPSPYWWILWAALFPGMILKIWVHIEQFYLAVRVTAAQHPSSSFSG